MSNENGYADPEGNVASSRKENLSNTSVHNVRSINSEKDRRQRIATAAYYRAERRGFRGGDEIKDWLEAETYVDMETIFPIKIDMTETDEEYIVRAQIPGVKKEDVMILVKGDLVSISAEIKQEKEKKENERVICRECYQGSSNRSFILGHNVNETKAQARCENGILHLILPKRNGVEIEIK